jgi:hypothetical protein
LYMYNLRIREGSDGPMPWIHHGNPSAESAHGGDGLYMYN